MEYQEAIKYLKENYNDQFSEDSFQDGATELLLNHFYHGLKHLVVNDEALRDTLDELIYKVSSKLDWFAMSYAAEAYIIAKEENTNE